jgi:hypothetical protein
MDTARSTVVSVVDQTVACSGLLDRYLAAYGPETQEARELLRHVVVRRAQVRWPAEDFGPPVRSTPNSRHFRTRAALRIWTISGSGGTSPRPATNRQMVPDDLLS